MTPQEFLELEKEIIIEIFDKNHEIVPQFTILRSTGKIERYVFANCIQNDKQKDDYYANMKKICKQPNVIACIQTMESWISKSESVRPSFDPDRKSAVIIVYYDKNKEKLFLYLDKNGKLEFEEECIQDDFHAGFGNPFSIINLKNKNYN